MKFILMDLHAPNVDTVECSVWAHKDICRDIHIEAHSVPLTHSNHFYQCQCDERKALENIG